MWHDWRAVPVLNRIHINRLSYEQWLVTEFLIPIMHVAYLYRQNWQRSDGVNFVLLRSSATSSGMYSLMSIENSFERVYDGMLLPSAMLLSRFLMPTFLRDTAG